MELLFLILYNRFRSYEVRAYVYCDIVGDHVCGVRSDHQGVVYKDCRIGSQQFKPSSDGHYHDLYCQRYSRYVHMLNDPLVRFIKFLKRVYIKLTPQLASRVISQRVIYRYSWWLYYIETLARYVIKHLTNTSSIQYWPMLS